MYTVGKVNEGVTSNINVTLEGEQIAILTELFREYITGSNKAETIEGNKETNVQ